MANTIATFKLQMIQILRAVLGHPESSVEWAVMVGVALVAALIGLNMAAAACRLEGMLTSHSWITVGVGTLLILIVVSAVRIYLDPVLDGVKPLYTAIGAVAVTVLVLILPMFCVMTKANYLKSMMCVVSSVLAAVILAFAADGTIGAIHQKKKDFKKIGDRQEEHDGFLKKNK
jgi:hypothetical protein